MFTELFNCIALQATNWLLDLAHTRSQRAHGTLVNRNMIRTRPLKEWCRRLALWSAIIGFAFVRSAFSSEQDDYDRLMTSGISKLQTGIRGADQLRKDSGSNARIHFEKALREEQAALEDFKAAEQLQPLSPDPALFRGVAFNRMAELIEDYNDETGSKERGAPKYFCSAVHEINRALRLGMTADKNPTLLVELAFALLNVGDNEQARTMAGQLLALENATPPLKEKAAGIQAAADAAIAKSKQPPPIHICGKAPRPATFHGAPVPADTQVQSQFLKSTTQGIGYNGNVTQLGRGLPLPATVSKKGAVFNESILSLEGDWFFHHKDGADNLVDKLAATYAIIHDAYDDMSQFNTLAQAGGLNYCRAFDKKTCLGLQLRDTWLRNDTKNISNTLVFQPSISYAETNELTSQLGYAIIRSDYSIAPRKSFAVLEGFAHQVSIQQTWSHALGHGEWSPQIGLTGKYLRLWTETDGIVGDRQRDNALIKCDWVIFQAGSLCSPIRSVSLTGSYEFRHDQYENATFPMPTAPNRFRRRDNTHLVDVALSVKFGYDEVLKNRLEGILQFQSTTNNSNVAAKSYDQPRLVASLKVNF